jgi:hypothetical protein
MAGYSVHYGAIGFAAYGVGTGNERFLTLGINLEYTILPVMAMTMAKHMIKDPLERMKYNLDQQHGDNWFSNLNVPPGTPQALLAGICLTYIVAVNMPGCIQDPSEELPSREDWDMLRDDMQRFERPPDEAEPPEP